MTTHTPTNDQAAGWLQRTVDSAREIITRAEAEDRDLTEAEQAEHDELVQRAHHLREEIQHNRTVQRGLAESRVGAMISGVSASGTERREEFGSHARLGAAPQLYLTRNQMRELHESYMTRAVTSATAPQAAVGQVLTLPGGTYPVLRDAFRILDLIPVQNVTGDGSQLPQNYYRGTNAADAATSVGEGGQKPMSDPSWTGVPLVVTKVAHYIPVPEELLMDGDGFADMVETEGLMGLLNEENRQIISGNGAAVVASGGIDMVGLLNTSGILTYAPAGAEARIVSIAHAQTLLQAGSSFTNPDSLIINPSDFEKVRLYQGTDNTFAAGFALGGDAQSMRVWGMRAFVTNRIAAGTALVGNLAQAAKVLVRMLPTVKVDPYSESTSNIVKFIFEERLSLTVPRPSALCKITFNGTT